MSTVQVDICPKFEEISSRQFCGIAFARMGWISGHSDIDLWSLKLIRSFLSKCMFVKIFKNVLKTFKRMAQTYRGGCEVTVASTFDTKKLIRQKYNQFIIESKWTSEQILQKLPQGVPEISHSWEWDWQTTEKHIAFGYACRQFGGLIFILCTSAPGISWNQAGIKRNKLPVQKNYFNIFKMQINVFEEFSTKKYLYFEGIRQSKACCIAEIEVILENSSSDNLICIQNILKTLSHLF